MVIASSLSKNFENAPSTVNGNLNNSWMFQVSTINIFCIIN